MRSMMRLLVLCLASSALLRMSANLSHDQLFSPAPPSPSLEPSEWCVEIPLQELERRTSNWRCAYGGEEALSQGGAAFNAVVWGESDTLWHRVQEGDGREDHDRHPCPPEAHLNYEHDSFLFSSDRIRLLGCGDILCEGEVNPDIFLVN